MMRRFYKLENKSGVTTIYIYEFIGDGFDIGYSAKRFVEDFKKIDDEEVHIHINSPGGSLFDALAIYNTIRASDKKVVTYVDGMAASAASIIFLAGGERVMPANTSLLIHDPTLLCVGGEEEMIKAAAFLKQLREQMIDIYAAASGLDESEIRNMVTKETILTGKQAKGMGFCDKVIEDIKVAASAGNMMEQFMAIYHPELVDNKQERDREEIVEKELREATAKVMALETDNGKLSKQLETANKELEETKAKLTRLNVEAQVDKDIAAKKLLPRSRDLAIKLRAQSEDVYNEFLEGYVMPEFSEVEIEGSDGKAMTFNDLLSNPAKLEKVRTENPKLFNKLYKEHMGGA